MRDIALEKAKSEGLGQARFKWADALDLPFEDESLRRLDDRLRRPQPG